MAETTTYQCPNCNGRLVFDGGAGKLRCESCDSLFTAQEVEQLYAAKQAQADARQAQAEGRQPATGAAGNQQVNPAAMQFAQAMGLNVAGLSDFERKVVSRAFEEDLARGLGEKEMRAHLVEVANQAALQAAASAAGASAAQASTTQAAHVDVAPIQSTGDPVQDYLLRARWQGEDADSMRAFNCPACGAQLMVDQVTAVTSCPYCGNNAVVPGQLSDILKPDVVIPFKLDKAAAIAALKNYYKGKRLLPDSFTAGNHIEEIQGVYVPFWLYSGTATGDVTFNARNVRMWSDSKYDYVETDHWELHRVGTTDYYRVPVDGSTKMPDAHMDAIEPFDYQELVPFSVAYLPGYIAERYDLDVKACEDRAFRRVATTSLEELKTTAGGYMEVDVAHETADIAWNEVLYALLPVWMLHTKWEGKDYLFAMNGQTGKFIGDLPVDRGKAVKRFLGLFLPVAVVIAVLAFFFLG